MTRSHEQLREHFEIERELAGRLRHANSREERRLLYGEVYRERSERIAHHPLVRLAGDPAARAASVAPQVRLLRRFLSPACRFLEVGAGDGAVTRALAPEVERALAFDVTDALFEPRSGDKLEFRTFDGFDLCLPDRTIDVAYSHDVVEHLHEDDMLEQSASIRRALVDGGVYICVTPNRLCGPHDISQHFSKTAEGFHLHEYTVTELAGALRSVGFRRVRVFLSRDGHRLAPQMPVGVIGAVESTLRRLPYDARRWTSRSLHAAKVVAIR
jgi:SAM-dependent methyltransferase